MNVGGLITVRTPQEMRQCSLKPGVFIIPVGCHVKV
jgi:hypothetical protein